MGGSLKIQYGGFTFLGGMRWGVHYFTLHFLNVTLRLKFVI